MATDYSIDELIENSFYSKNRDLYELSKDELIKIIKYFNIKSSYKTKYLIIKQLKPIQKKYRRIRQLENTDYNEECPICFNKLEKDSYIITKCCHIFCKKCIIHHIVIGDNDFCPYCRNNCLSLEDIFILPIENELLDELCILKITPDIMNTGLFILENIRFQQYITDSNIIQLIQDYQIRQLYISKFYLFVKFGCVLLLLYMLNIHLR